MSAAPPDPRGNFTAARRAIQPILRTILETVIRQEVGGEPDAALVDETARLMSEKLAAMPRYLGIGMVFATWAFDGWAVATAGRPFRLLPPERRELALDRWRNSRFGLMRSFTDFYGKMGIFVYYSIVEERHAAGETRSSSEAHA